MLRESSQHAGTAVELRDITAGLSDATAIAHGDELVGFAEAVVSRDAARIAAAREAVLEALGATALVDVAATVAAFHGFVRIADAIGIPFETASGGRDLPELREQTGVNAFHRVTHST